MIRVFTTQAALVVARRTTTVPVVFLVGTDPVEAGLVKTFSKPGGRLTGIHSLSVDLTAKRLELLKQLAPEIRRVVTVYRPENRASQLSVTQAREAARRLRIDLVELTVHSGAEIEAALRGLKPGDADAFLFVADGMVLSRASLVVETARRNKLPTIFGDRGIVAGGAPASYGVSFRRMGQLSAKLVARILAGAKPEKLPVESVHSLEFVINLGTARQLGLTISRDVLNRADELIR
jgi:putative ABC transport system substrate-binding protein